MSATTPAAIAAEDNIAQRSHYEPNYPIDLLHEHPKNIRHNATADDELIASVREQGILQPLVAYKDPAIEGAQLVAGHRRLDALRRAGYTHAPVILRYDLHDEGEQVAAMLVENGRRENLSPIEEAEGFDLLTELGWTNDQIAQASGRSKTLIGERRKLVRLPEKTRDRVDAGQVTIDDALRLAKLPAAEQTRIDKVPTVDFKLELGRTEQRIAADAEITAEKKRLRDAGVPELDQPKDINSVWNLNHADHGMVRLPLTGKPDASDHDGCLAFVVAKPHYDGGSKSIWQVCTNPGRHDEELTAEQLQRRTQAEADAAAEAEAREIRLAELEEQRQATRVARQLRIDTALAAIRRNSIDPTLEALIRIGLKTYLANEGIGHAEAFQTALNIPDEQRWEERHQINAEWLMELDRLPANHLLKVLAAWLADQIEWALEDPAYEAERGSDTIRGWFNLLGTIGHEVNAVDQQILDTLTQAEQETAR